MAYIDDSGVLVAEPAKGDTLRMFYNFRPKDYGPLKTPAPVLISHHATARWMKDNEPRFAPGMPEMGARANKHDAYTHVYVDRSGACVQVVRYGRSCIGNEGSVIVGGKKLETNRVSFQIEWDNWGACDRKGFRGAGSPTINPKRADAIANPDTKAYPGEFWQNVPVVQAVAIAEICVAVVARSGMRPIDALHGHYELGRRSHIDPGPVIIAALETIVAPRLGLGTSPVVRAPARNIRSVDPIVISGPEVA